MKVERVSRLQKSFWSSYESRDDICEYIWDHTLWDTNREFLEAVHARLETLGSFKRAALGSFGSEHYLVISTVDSEEAAVKKLVSEVYTEYLQSELPLAYPFEQEVVHTLNPKSLTPKAATDNPPMKAAPNAAIGVRFFNQMQDGSIEANQIAAADYIDAYSSDSDLSTSSL
jgi:hypothetical protein